MSATPDAAPTQVHAGAVLLAAGSSARMQGVDKTLVPVAGLPLAAHALRAFAASAGIELIVLISGPGNHAALEALAAEHGGGKVVAVTPGGARRQDSVARGLTALPPTELVAVHDCARPLVTPAMIARGLALARTHGAAVACGPLPDTIKEISATGVVLRTLHRNRLRAAQTPQVFQRALLQRAHAAAGAAGAATPTAQAATDDAMLVESLGHAVHLYDSDGPNLKVTVTTDLALVDALLQARTRAGV